MATQRTRQVGASDVPQRQIARNDLTAFQDSVSPSSLTVPDSMLTGGTPTFSGGDDESRLVFDSDGMKWVDAYDDATLATIKALFAVEDPPVTNAREVEIRLDDLEGPKYGTDVGRMARLRIVHDKILGNEGFQSQFNQGLVELEAQADSLSPSTSLKVSAEPNLRTISLDADEVTVNGTSLGRGLLGGGYFSAAGTDSARASGVNTDMNVAVTVDNTRLYRVHVRTQFNLGTLGVNYALELTEGGTVGVADGTDVERFGRWNLSESGSSPLWCATSTLYAPATSGAKTLRVKNSSASGGTVTLTAGIGHRAMWIEDIGAQ